MSIMKRILSSLITIFIFSLSYSQSNMGLIEVNGNYTATCKFPSTIDFVVIGNNTQIGVTPDGEPIYKNYDLYKSGNILVIKIKSPQTSKTSITVNLKNNNILFYGEIQCGENPKILYDYSAVKDSTPEKPSQSNDSLIQINKIIEKIKYVMNMPGEYEEGMDENQIMAIVVNIVNDDKYTYFKIIINNKSGSDYTIANVNFKYIEGKNKGLLRKESKIEERKRIAYETGEKVVKAYSTLELGYAIPLYTVGSSGDLEIQFIEKNGTRNLRIGIQSKTMLKVNKIDLM